MERVMPRSHSLSNGEIGWGTSFHFCRYYPGEEFFRAIARHEHYLAANTGIKSGMKVLDVSTDRGLNTDTDSLYVLSSLGWVWCW